MTHKTLALLLSGSFLATVLSSSHAVDLKPKGTESCALRPGYEQGIKISSVLKSGDYYSEDFEVHGQLSAECLRDAAIFENGEKIAEILSDSEKTKSKEFRVVIDSSKNPEIRGHTTTGREILYPIDVLDHRG